MDQQKPKNKIFKFLPRATSSVSFQNPPVYSPAKDKRSSEKTLKSHLGIGFSGPMVSMIPADTRRKIKNDSTYEIVYEPTSPRVSCMGQVKCKHQSKKPSGARKKTTGVGKPGSQTSQITSSLTTYDGEDDRKKRVKSKKKIGLMNIFGGGSGGGGRKPDAPDDNSKAAAAAAEEAASVDMNPSLSKMKRFSSGRDAFANFDWTTQVAPVDSDHQNYCSDEESRRDCDEETDEEVMIPLSAPVVMRNKEVGDDFIRVRVRGLSLEPRKEINLWKRRTMPQPKPLQLHAD